MGGRDSLHGSDQDTMTSPANRSHPIASGSPVNAPSSPPTAPATQRPVSRTLRGPLFPGTPPRSISLPQALHSLTFSTRSGNPKSARNASDLPVQSGGTVAGMSGPDETHQGSGAFASDEAGRAASLPSSSSSPSALISAPVSPTYKRAISEGHGNSLMEFRVGRSETTNRLPELMYGDTELLDPLSRSEPRAQHSDIQHLDTQCLAAAEFDRADARAGFQSADAHLDSSWNYGSNDSPINDMPMSAVQIALSNVDILHHIFDALDAMTIVPHELVQQRRKPLSLRHAQLIFGDTKKATEAWEKAQPTTTAHSPGAGLYNCLFVNSTWHDAAVRVLETRIHFRKNEEWTKFARRGASVLSRKPRMLVLHKLNEATQVELDMLDSAQLGESLEWLEFYTCAGLAPPASMLGMQLTRIILPGCYRVNDRTLAHIAEKCPRLEHLDVRACEQVSDRGIKMIAKYCPQLQLLNVGRTRGGENITYKGIKHLARQTQITTLGIAGCHIDDRAIWELALNRGPHLQRLSLNNCRLLTDASVPRVLGYMPNLTVLEIRGCVQITHMRPLALFKAYRERLGQPPLIEGCEVIERRMQVAVLRLQREMSQRIVNDLLSWVNSEEAEA